MDSQHQQDEGGFSFIVCEENGASTRYFIYGLWTGYFVVLFLSLVLILGLLIPLLKQLKDGSFYFGAIMQRRGSGSTMLQGRGSGSFSSSIPQRRGSINRSRASFSQSRASFSRMTPRESTYSTYNLYLVYLAFVDLVFVVLKLSADMMALNQNYNPSFYSELVVVFMDDPPPLFKSVEVNGTPPPLSLYLDVPYAATNMWINTIIAYELFILLRATHSAQRIKQPSLRRVNLQGLGVIFGSILLSLLYYYQIDLLEAPYENWWSPIIALLTGMIAFNVPAV